jgi:uncharacterized protein with NRDE domain
VCLIVLAVGMRPDLPLIVAANRDEFHARASDPLGEWPDRPGVVGGRDREKGGSWLALHRTGRFAAVTNVRDPARRHPSPRSRGALVSEFLCGTTSAAEAADEVVAAGSAYDGFNLLLSDGRSLWYATNRDHAPRQLGPGIHGLSNHRLGTPWPKVRRAQDALRAAIALPKPRLESALLALLADETPVDDTQLPQTGVGLELERLLATAFIRAPHYGTRASTLLLWGAAGDACLVERRFGPGGTPLGETRMELQFTAPA